MYAKPISKIKPTSLGAARTTTTNKKKLCHYRAVLTYVIKLIQLFQKKTHIRHKTVISPKQHYYSNEKFHEPFKRTSFIEVGETVISNSSVGR